MIKKIRSYLYTKKVNREFMKRLEALEVKAANDDRSALFEIGMLYENGVGVKKDMEKASNYYLRAADLGMNEAQCKIADWYERGEYFERDLFKSLMWYKKCSEKNNFDDAMNFARVCSNEEFDVDDIKDYLPKAIDILNDAIKIGEIDAMAYLGALQLRGLDEGANPEDGYKLLKIAAFKGQVEAQILLGDACANGKGTERNLIESRRWYEVAAKNGSVPALEKLEA